MSQGKTIALHCEKSKNKSNLLLNLKIYGYKCVTYVTLKFDEFLS